MPYVVTTSECGCAILLTFCHSANKNRYAQIISGYVPGSNQKMLSVLISMRSLVQRCSMQTFRFLGKVFWEYHLVFFQMSLTGTLVSKRSFTNILQPSAPLLLLQDKDEALLTLRHQQQQLQIQIKNKISVIRNNCFNIHLIFIQIFKYTTNVISPSSEKRLTMPLNDIISLVMKATTVGQVAYT